MTSATDVSERPQSAAAPSPFPPIADYAFLSNCHTGALIAPDGGIGWLCVPRFDSPSVFGTLLDRQAGHFRLGPFAANVPAARAYEPGTNMLVTTWQRADRLDRGARRADAGPAADRGQDHAAHAPAVRRRRRPHARAHRRVHRGQRRHRPGLRARVRLRPRRRRSGRSWATTGTTPTRPAPASRSGWRPTCCSGVEGDRVRARRLLKQGERAFCSLSWAEELASPGRRRRGDRAPRGDDAVLALLGRSRADPRPPLARADPALGARDQGAHVHADRRHGRGAHDVAARDARRRAQLGLPLHLDPRRDVHAAGAALAEPRLGGRRVHAVRRRPRARRRRLAADHVRDRRAARPDRVDDRRALRLRRRAPGARRQRRVRPAPERRVRRRAGLDPAAHAPQRAAPAAAVADRARRRPRTPRACGASPTRGSGRRAERRSTTSPPS